MSDIVEKLVATAAQLKQAADELDAVFDAAASTVADSGDEAQNSTTAKGG